jgi:hypothetical protein
MVGLENSDLYALFENSAYSNPFWSDSVNDEDLELLRKEVKKRQLSIEKASKQMLRTPFWRRGPLKEIIQEGFLYPDKGLYDRSFFRFQRWLAELGMTDPEKHALIVKWFQDNELKDERERQRQEAEARARLERESRARVLAESLEIVEVGKEANERGTSETLYQQTIAKHQSEADEAERRRVEWHHQHQQQYNYQVSEDNSSSDTKCVFCDRSGMHKTASGWMCGIHLDGLM